MFKVKEKWKSKYQNAMNRWEENWEVLTSTFNFSAEVRKVIHITNVFERLNPILSKYDFSYIPSVLTGLKRFCMTLGFFVYFNCQN